MTNQEATVVVFAMLFVTIVICVFLSNKHDIEMRR